MKLNRFVGIILVNAEAKVLLQLRCSDEYLYPNHWTLPGGRVEEGESLEQAVLREVKEEVGLDLCDYHLFKTIVINAFLDEITERDIYWGNISESVENLELGEGTALRYFSSKEIPGLEVAFDLKPVIIDFLKMYRSKKHGSEPFHTTS